MHAALSSLISEAGRDLHGSLDRRDGVKVDIGCFSLRVTAIGPKLDSSVIILYSGSSCRVAMLRAMYSVSVVASAISVSSLLDHVMGQLQ